MGADRSAFIEQRTPSGVRAGSLLKRLHSLRNAFWFALSRRIRWSRGLFREKAAGELRGLTPEQDERVAALRDRYQVNFEQRLSNHSSTINYEYLDILDRAWQARSPGLPPPHGGVVCDVGCASFWYAAALYAFFRPERLLGVEIEGHRLFRDGRARIDYAAGYVAEIPNAEFVVADYTRFDQPADVITAWFPFLTATAILAWRLPLSLLAPESLFASIKHNLKPVGQFVMVNHGLSEADLAAERCSAAGLRQVARWQDPGPLSAYRLAPPVLSWWQHAKKT